MVEHADMGRGQGDVEHLDVAVEWLLDAGFCLVAEEFEACPRAVGADAERVRDIDVTALGLAAAG